MVGNSGVSSVGDLADGKDEQSALIQTYVENINVNQWDFRS